MSVLGYLSGGEGRRKEQGPPTSCDGSLESPLLTPKQRHGTGVEVPSHDSLILEKGAPYSFWGASQKTSIYEQGGSGGMAYVSHQEGAAGQRFPRYRPHGLLQACAQTPVAAPTGYSSS